MTERNDGLTVLIAEPHGMCGGVRRALGLVEEALRGEALRGEALRGEERIYVLHEIVHNNHIVRQLTDRGVIFVQELSDVPEGATVLFSAHGVGLSVEAEAAERKLRVVDATCPLVKKLHREVRESVARGEAVVLLGHAGHPEVTGTLGQVTEGAMVLVETAEGVDGLPEYDGRGVRLLTQTTLEMELVEGVTERMRRRYGERLKTGDGVCYATRDRQRAVKEVAERADMVIVMGSPRSSNSNRLREVAERMGVRAVLVDEPEELDGLDWGGVKTVGVTAGASAPDELIRAAIARLRRNQ